VVTQRGHRPVKQVVDLTLVVANPKLGLAEQGIEHLLASEQ
jgi:hypothetical protein